MRDGTVSSLQESLEITLERHPWLAAPPEAVRQLLRAYPAVLLVVLVATRDVDLGGLLGNPLFAGYSAAAAVYAVARIGARRASRSPAPTLSIVIPVLDGEARIEETLEAFLKPNELGPAAEVVVVNDCSSDTTWRRILSAKGRHPELHAIDLGRRYGRHAAMVEGARRASGDVVAFVECGARVDQAALPALLEEFTDGSVDVVAGRVGGGPGGPYRFTAFKAPAQVPTLAATGGDAVAYRRAYLLDRSRDLAPETFFGAAAAEWPPSAAPESEGAVPSLVQAFAPGTCVYLDDDTQGPESPRPPARQRPRRLHLRPSTAFASLPLLVLPVAAFATLSAADSAAQRQTPRLVAPAVPLTPLTGVAQIEHASQADTAFGSSEGAALPARRALTLVSNRGEQQRFKRPRRQPSTDPAGRTETAPAKAPPAISAAAPPPSTAAGTTPPRSGGRQESPPPPAKPAATPAPTPATAPAPVPTQSPDPPSANPAPPAAEPPPENEESPPPPSSNQPEPKPEDGGSGNGNGNGNGKAKGHDKVKTHGRGAAGGPPGRVGK